VRNLEDPIPTSRQFISDGSPGSIDSDLLSVSDPEEEICGLGSDDLLYPHLDAATERALREFAAWRQYHGDAQNSLDGGQIAKKGGGGEKENQENRAPVKRGHECRIQAKRETMTGVTAAVVHAPLNGRRRLLNRSQPLRALFGKKIGRPIVTVTNTN
jgi:predicted Zn-dependent protease